MYLHVYNIKNNIKNVLYDSAVSAGKVEGTRHPVPNVAPT